MPESSYFPLFLRLHGEPVLLVGGGEVAARKLQLLLRAGARVQIVAAELGDEVGREVAAGRAEHRATRFDAAQLAGQRLAIAATDDAALNAAVAAAAERANV
ncbi:MAG: precorrin-2 dehydrogenase/sirohydrochlorin ferrochelatase family protein, partial [Solimonas sp.]